MVTSQPVFLFSSFAEDSIVGLAVSGTYPMEFTAEKNVGKIEGYLNVVNDGGLITGYYNVSIEGQIVDLTDWDITITPTTFNLEPDESQTVKISIICAEVEGKYTGEIHVSAFIEESGIMGKGIAEILVPIEITLTPLGIIVYSTDLGTATEITRPELFTINNPAIIDSNPNAPCILFITQISQPCKITVENISSLSSEVSPPPELKVIGNYLKIDSNTSITFEAILEISYDPQQLNEDELDTETASIYIWEGEWRPLESEINTETHFISANIDQLGYFAVMIRTQEPVYTKWWVWFSVLIATIFMIVLVKTRLR